MAKYALITEGEYKNRVCKYTGSAPTLIVDVELDDDCFATEAIHWSQVRFLTEREYFVERLRGR